MSPFVALLRGVNVSGRNPLRMADLRASLAGLCFRGVETYLQSGNVLFDAGADDVRRHASAIRARIAADFGHQVEVLVLPARQMQEIAGAHPLWPGPGADARLFHGTFLLAPVAPRDFARICLPVQPGEQAILVGQVVMLHCPGGYGRTKLNNIFFEKELGVPATTRNWRTVLALSELCAKR